MIENKPPRQHMSARTKLIVGIATAAVGIGALGVGGNYLINNTDVFAGPKSQVIRTLNESNLSMDDRLYLFDYNSRLVDTGKGIPICDQYVIDRAAPNQQLDFLLGEVKETNAANYAPIAKAMVEQIGTNIYSWFTGIFKGGK